jgi:S-formylglutathione hydrolase FrmB
MDAAPQRPGRRTRSGTRSRRCRPALSLVVAACVAVPAFGCGAAPDPGAAGATSGSGTTAAPNRTEPPATTATTPGTTTGTTAGGRGAHGAVEKVAIPGTVSGFKARATSVYLPPSYVSEPSRSLPVLLVLGGIPGAEDDWVTGGRLPETVDAFAAAHGGRAPIMVMTDFSGDGLNDTQCTDAKKGNAETYLTVDVLSYVHAHFHSATDRRETGVVGLSSGGFCALMLPLRHPDLFNVFASYSAVSQPELDPPGVALRDLFGNSQASFDAYDPTKILATRTFPGMAGWFETGSGDTEALGPTRKVVAQAQSAGIETCLLVRAGGHDYGFWSAALRNSLPWLAYHLGLSPAPADRSGATCSPATSGSSGSSGSTPGTRR